MEKIVFCNKIGCEGHSNLIFCKYNFFFVNIFIVMLIKKCMNEIFSCQVNEKRDICGFCKNCEACMKLLEFRLELQDVYYYNGRTDALFQPTRWIVYFLRDKERIAIVDVRKSRSIKRY